MGSGDRFEERRRKTLDQLEGGVSKQAPYPSHVVTTCHRLRTKPIGEFTVEELRLAIGQGMGIQFLLPFALEELERDPLAEGDLFPGDLLRSVLGIDVEHWRRDPNLHRRVLRIVDAIPDIPGEVRDALGAFRGASGG